MGAETTFDRTLTAAKAGAETAWVTLFEELAGPVTGYLRSRGAREPEDLASEVLLQIARDIHRFEGDQTAFRSWVFVIAHRRLIDARRKTFRRPQTIGDWNGEHFGGDVEEEAIEGLGLTGMREVLDVLTDDQRDVLALRVIADLSLAETARVLGKRVGAIKALQRRGLETVRQHLAEGRVTL